MSHNIPPSNSRVGKKEEEEREDPSTLVQRWRTSPTSKTRQRVPLILHALPQELFLAAIDAGDTADSDIDHCCEILTQLAIDQREQSLAREFFHRDQKADNNNGEHADDLQHLAERAFR
ncbi:hypothetical protein TSMEX_003054, partial [Taenia solium]